MFPGVETEIGGDKLVVPALSLGQLRNGVLAKLQQHDELVAAGKFYEAVVLRGEVILAALRRNYPDYDEEKLFANLDLHNSLNIWQSILGISGFTPGEAPAAETAKEPGI